MQHSLQQLAQEAIVIAQQAGAAILKYFDNGDFEQFSKDDESPVTSADYAANEVVLAALEKLTPDIPIMSEETEGLKLADRKNWQRYWLIDPLDGTQEFVAGRSDFAVNIALVENNQPVLGVIYAPVTKTTFWAAKGHGTHKVHHGKTKQVFATKLDQDQERIRVATSRVQTLETITRYIRPLKKLDFVSLGSCALKCCLIAEGEADIYIRVGPTGEWDTGAPQIIVAEAGGAILDSEFEPLTYNKRESTMNPNFFVHGDAEFDWSPLIMKYPSRRDEV